MLTSLFVLSHFFIKWLFFSTDGGSFLTEDADDGRKYLILGKKDVSRTS